MSAMIGLVREHERGRWWHISCAYCNERVATVKLPYGALEEYLMGLTTCPSGKHRILAPGTDLTVRFAWERKEPSRAG